MKQREQVTFDVQQLSVRESQFCSEEHIPGDSQDLNSEDTIRYPHPLILSRSASDSAEATELAREVQILWQSRRH
jgi:hypothetical protein